MFTIKYDNKLVNKQYLTPNETSMKPTISYNFENDKLYTLIMYDPDTPYGDYIHWTIINIKNNVDNGIDVIPYKGPSPPKNTGFHRYIFLLFEQDKLINENNINNIKQLERNIELINLLNKLNINKEITSQYFISQFQSGSYQKKNKKIKKSKKTRKSKNPKKPKNITYKINA